MKHGALFSVLSGALALVAVTSASADSSRARILDADLNGFNETPLTLSSPASADFDARINKDDTQITYTITYKGFRTNVLQSHLHLGRKATTGGVMVFLCTNLGNGPAGTPACPNDVNADGTFSGTVTGTLMAADVVGGAAAQGIAPGEFAEVLAAIRAGAAYANVHSVAFPTGEVRDQVKAFGF